MRSKLSKYMIETEVRKGFRRVYSEGETGISLMVVALISVHK